MIYRRLGKIGIIPDEIKRDLADFLKTNDHAVE